MPPTIAYALVPVGMRHHNFARRTYHACGVRVRVLLLSSKKASQWEAFLLLTVVDEVRTRIIRLLHTNHLKNIRIEALMTESLQVV